MLTLADSERSAQGYQADSRNDAVMVYLNGELVPRSEAKVSIFDSGFVLGDGVWEGLRLVKGRIVAIEAHMERIYEGASALMIDIGMSRDELVAAIMDTLKVNDMSDGVHIRLMISRGRKTTPNQDPRFVLGGATIVIVPEYKLPRPEAVQNGVTLFTSTFRCSPPDVFNLHLNTHSRLNFIQALIQAISAGADEALMLDPNGFVASCNSTNFFIVRKGELWTSTGRFNFKGITRSKLIDLAARNSITVREKDFTLAEVYTADEAFVTGTLASLLPVRSIDGRQIGESGMGPISALLRQLYLDSL
ncbi:aminotransferase class IV [Sphingobium sp. H39-3-25]|uniref:aminotransferase class IV n=1 Tax=Sphingobium arseniciresistens TaxID=3030834 RepID=UPI0023B9024C|nr:aminotransferase class IV [Sphingobium arseniciresistens]